MRASNFGVLFMFVCVLAYDRMRLCVRGCTRLGMGGFFLDLGLSKLRWREDRVAFLFSIFAVVYIVFCW